MTEADVTELAGHGFDEDAVTIAVQVISYFNYINRIADGLGTDPEPDMTPDRATWDRERGRNYSGRSDR